MIQIIPAGTTSLENTISAWKLSLPDRPWVCWTVLRPGWNSRDLWCPARLHLSENISDRMTLLFDTILHGNGEVGNCLVPCKKTRFVFGQDGWTWIFYIVLQVPGGSYWNNLSYWQVWVSCNVWWTSRRICQLLPNWSKDFGLKNWWNHWSGEGTLLDSNFVIHSSSHTSIFNKKLVELKLDHKQFLFYLLNKYFTHNEILWGKNNCLYILRETISVPFLFHWGPKQYEN